MVTKEERVRGVLEEMFETYKEKNAAYGDSFGKTVNRWIITCSNCGADFSLDLEGSDE